MFINTGIPLSAVRYIGGPREEVTAVESSINAQTFQASSLNSEDTPHSLNKVTIKSSLSLSTTALAEKQFLCMQRKLFWQSILESEIPYKIRERLEKDLLENGLLVNQDELDILSDINKFPVGTKLAKNETRNFSAVNAGKCNIFTLYRGKGTEESLIVGKGKLGHIKFAQNLTTKEICLVKIQLFNKTECELLNRQKLLLGSVNLPTNSRDVKQYIFMKWVPGVSLLRMKKILTINKIDLSAIEQMKLVISALKELQKLINNNIWHSDLYEGNIMVDPLTWEVAVIDFGIASDCGQKEEEDQNCDKYSTALEYIITFTEFIKNDELILFLKKLRRSLEASWIVHKSIYNIHDALSELEKTLASKISH